MTHMFNSPDRRQATKPLATAIACSLSGFIALVGLLLPLVTAYGQSAGSAFMLTLGQGRSIIGGVFIAVTLLAAIVPLVAYANWTKLHKEWGKPKKPRKKGRHTPPLGPVAYLVFAIIGLVCMVLFLFVIEREIEGLGGRKTTVWEYGQEWKVVPGGGHGAGFWLSLLGFWLITVTAAILVVQFRRSHKELKIQLAPQRVELPGGGHAYLAYNPQPGHDPSGRPHVGPDKHHGFGGTQRHTGPFIQD